MKNKINNFLINIENKNPEKIYFEDELVMMLIKKKILTAKDLIYNKHYKYIKVKNIKHDLTKKNYIYEEVCDIKKTKSKNKNDFIVEIIIVKEPKILEMYYNIKQIKYEKIKNPEIPKEVINCFLLNFHSLILNTKEPLNF